MTYSLNLQIDLKTRQKFSKVSNLLTLKEFSKIVIPEEKRESVEFFEYEESPEGKGWKTSLRVLEHGGKTLHEYGYLEESMQNDETYKLNEEEQSIDTDSYVSYAKDHQFGVPERKVPVREFAGLTKNSIAKIKINYSNLFKFND